MQHARHLGTVPCTSWQPLLQQKDVIFWGPVSIRQSLPGSRHHPRPCMQHVQHLGTVLCRSWQPLLLLHQNIVSWAPVSISIAWGPAPSTLCMQHARFRHSVLQFLHCMTAYAFVSLHVA